MRYAALGLLAFALVGAVLGQPRRSMVEDNALAPDGKTEITCDLPAELRMHNTGGLGPGGPGTGSGLCVFTSCEHCGRYSNVEAMVGFQRKMTHEPGGGHPEKLAVMMRKYCPGVDYLQHTGGDVEWLKAALKTGRMVAITYCGHDSRYGNQTIAHMVNAVHLDDHYGAILDNNFPGKVLWMTSKELIDRWLGQDASGKPYLVRAGRFGPMVPVGGGWAVALTAPAPPPPPRL